MAFAPAVTIISLWLFGLVSTGLLFLLFVASIFNVGIEPSPKIHLHTSFFTNLDISSLLCDPTCGVLGGGAKYNLHNQQYGDSENVCLQ